MKEFSFKAPVPYPSIVFLYATLFFQFLPAAYIHFFQEYSARGSLHSEVVFFLAAERMFFSSTYLVFTFLALWLLVNKTVGQKGSSDSYLAILSVARIRRLVAGLLFLSFCFIFLYGVNGGFQKVALLGSDWSSRDYRYLNFNEVPREYTYMLQVARRIILPAAIFVLFFLYFRGLRALKGLIFIACVLQILGGAMTFARAPFAMLLVSIFFAMYLSYTSVLKRLLVVLVAVICLVLMAGLITKLQYNIVEFDLVEITETGADFLVNRSWLVPVAVAINLSFALFDGETNNLYLSGSRLLGFFTGDVIGTLEGRSLIVAPVGFIGDIWRNFGVWGLAFSPWLFFSLFYWLDARFEKLNPFKRMLGSYLTVALVFYWIMGVFFSAGAMLTLLAVCFVHFPKVRLRRSHDISSFPSSIESTR
ncbi:MAG: hypothetical protein JJ957_10985 [Pseudomonadales bacterium]|nr:hypothetical protein [Pseudomonadales bacterium]MBO6595977.1 hypothetical protein [Pseudomonadales bacterium]MBO6822460.1 hypothetical protein [Pseudomonadales bacterium]